MKTNQEKVTITIIATFSHTLNCAAFLGVFFTRQGAKTRQPGISVLRRTRQDTVSTLAGVSLWTVSEFEFNSTLTLAGASLPLLKLLKKRRIIKTLRLFPTDCWCLCTGNSAQWKHVDRLLTSCSCVFHPSVKPS